MKNYTKKEIEKMILEKKGYKVFSKNNLILKEEGNAFVTNKSNNSGTSSLASDLTTAKTDNPTDNNFVVDANSYDSNRNNDTVTLDVVGDNPTDASKKFQQMSKNPNVKRLINTTKVNANIHIKENIKNLRETSVPFTKKEIKKIFK